MNAQQVAKAIADADWSNVSIGNKAILCKAVELLAASASAEPVAWIDAKTLQSFAEPQNCNKEQRVSIRRADAVYASDAPLYAAPRPIEAPDNSQAVEAAYVDWDLVERMRCGEEIDSEEAGMVGAMIDGQASEIEALRAALSAPASRSAEPAQSYCAKRCRVMCQNSTHGVCDGAPKES
jgi:hypothetical protein